MVIEPRQVEPGALRRWIGQACGLIRRGVGFWLAITLGFCLWMFLGQRFPLLDGALALAAFFASIVIAQTLDRSQAASLSDVLAAIRIHARAIAGFSIAIACAGALVWMLVLSKPGVPWWNALYSERNVVQVLATNPLGALRQVFVYSAYALGLSYFGLNLPGLTSLFQFPLTVLGGASWRDAYRLSAAAQVCNLAAMLGVGLLWIALPVLFALFLPPVVPLLYCFFGALCYVAYREIFLGIGENRVLEARAVVASGAHVVRGGTI